MMYLMMKIKMGLVLKEYFNPLGYMLIHFMAGSEITDEL